MARNARWVVTHEETLTQAVDVLHNVGLCGGLAHGWKGDRVLGFMFLLANHHHVFEAEVLAVQIPEELECWRALARQFSLERQQKSKSSPVMSGSSQQNLGSSNGLAEAKGRLFPAHVTFSWVIAGPNRAARFSMTHCIVLVHMAQRRFQQEKYEGSGVCYQFKGCSDSGRDHQCEVLEQVCTKRRLDMSLTTGRRSL